MKLPLVITIDSMRRRDADAHAASGCTCCYSMPHNCTAYHLSRSSLRPERARHLCPREPLGREWPAPFGPSSLLRYRLFSRLGDSEPLGRIPTVPSQRWRTDFCVDDARDTKPTALSDAEAPNAGCRNVVPDLSSMRLTQVTCFHIEG